MLLQEALGSIGKKTGIQYRRSMEIGQTICGGENSRASLIARRAHRWNPSAKSEKPRFKSAGSPPFPRVFQRAALRMMTWQGATIGKGLSIGAQPAFGIRRQLSRQPSRVKHVKASKLQHTGTEKTVPTAFERMSGIKSRARTVHHERRSIEGPANENSYSGAACL